MGYLKKNKLSKLAKQRQAFVQNGAANFTLRAEEHLLRHFCFQLNITQPSATQQPTAAKMQAGQAARWYRTTAQRLRTMAVAGA